MREMSGADYSVWIVEDNALLRESYAEVIDRSPGLVCPATFETCEAAIAVIESGASPPQLILMDIGLPGMTGIEGIQRIAGLSPETRIMVLTVHDDRDNVFEALCAGAAGYVLKPETSAKVVDAVREVQAGGVPMNGRIAQRVLNIFQTLTLPTNDYGLTRREVEVLNHLVAGSSQKGIAKLLALSPHTVNTHIRNVYAKLHVTTRSSVVAKALRERLV